MDLNNQEIKKAKLKIVRINGKITAMVGEYVVAGISDIGFYNINSKNMIKGLTVEIAVKDPEVNI